MSTTAAKVTPERIMTHTFGFIATHALACAVDLDLFTQVHQGADSPQALVQRLGASERGVRRLVGALTALGYLTQNQGKIALAPDAETFLVRGSQGYLGGLVQRHHGVGERWSQITEVVRKGQIPHVGVESDEDQGKFFATFVDALFALNWPAAQMVAAHLAGGKPRQALDIGAGSAVWSLALAQAVPDLQVVAVDRQEVLDKVTSVFTTRLGAADRFTHRVGNFRDVDLGSSAFEVAYLGHILHSEGPARSATLLRRLHEALRPQGSLVVAEMVADEAHAQELMPQLFGLNMLMMTEEGDVFSGPELERMCREAGFASTQWLQTPSPSPVLIARNA